jgi:hypothetical protein
LVLIALSSPALALPGGTIVVTDHALDPKSGSFEKELKKAQKTSLAKTNGSWHVYFVAYLNKAAGTKELNFVFYELGKKGGEPTAFPIGTQESAKIVMSDFEISSEQGVTPGKYEVRVTRLANGKEEVYAKAKLELK